MINCIEMPLRPVHAKRFTGCFASSITRSRLSHHHFNIHKKYLSNNTKQLPNCAEIVIAGGGITGSSVAYHLAKYGKKDVVVLEQGSLGCGTTWHSVGLLGRLRQNPLHYNMSLYGFDLYSQLENDTGLSTGIKKCGGLMVARTKGREIDLRRIYDRVKIFENDIELLSPKEAQELYPIMKIDDLKLAVWSPNEGCLNASDACSSLMRGATQRGVQFFDGVCVKKVCTNGKRVVGVETDRGYIHCEKFVNCGGQWAREIGLRTDNQVNLPLHSCEHFYIVTKPMQGVHKMLPVLRDQDAYIYIREWSGGLLAGGFEPMGKPCFYETGVPDKFEFQLLQEDWEQFEILMHGTVNRIPSIKNAEIRQFVNGPESFTPDGKFLFGEVPEVDNYFTACGMNSGGILNAPGMGRLTAELITEGSCSWDVSSIDVKRFTKEQNNKFFLHERVGNVLGQHYIVMYPDEQNYAARPLKSSPLYDVLTSQGAEWGEIGGWERANWFNKGGKESGNTFGKPSWYENVKEEYKACKEKTGIVDLSWQSKFEITSSNASNLVDGLQRLFAVDVNLAVGKSITAAMLNEKGNYVVVADIHRLNDSRFLIVTSPKSHNALLSWISKNSDSSLRIEDVTARYGCIGFFGPDVVDLLGKLTLQPLNGFAMNGNKFIDLGNASSVILRRGYFADASNWQAFIPSELCRGVYKNIFEAGTPSHVGHLAVNALRVQSGFLEMGTDFGSLSSPLDFDNPPFVEMNKASDFIGKNALQNSATSVKRSLFSIAFNCDEENWAWGGEPVFADGEPIGSLSSVSYNFSQDSMLAIGLFPSEKVLKSDVMVVRIANQDKILRISSSKET